MQADGHNHRERRQTIKVGVVGCGAIAYWAHLRALQRLNGATLAAAADPDPAARARAAPMVRGPIFSDAAALLQSDVDAVVISTPPSLHAELAIAAARAGKHIYIEKPLATTAADARAVADAIDRSGCVAVLGFNYRYHPAHALARPLLQKGTIGRIRAVHTVFCEPVPAESVPEWKRWRRSGGGVLLDLASHHVDLLRWFLDDEIATVEATIGSIETEQDTATVKLTTRGGIDVQMYLSFRAGPADHLEFVGETGTLRVDRHGLVPRLQLRRRRGYGTRSAWLVPPVSDVAVWMRRLARPSYQPSYVRALGAFVDRINGRDVAPPTVEDGVRSLAVVLAAEEAALRRAATTVA